MRQHVEHDAAAVLGAVVPRRALRRLEAAGEHPIAELAAHRQDPPEEAGFHQQFEFADPRQPELVLDDAVLDSGGARAAGQGEGVGGAEGGGLLAIDVLPRRYRALQQAGAAGGERGVEEDGPGVAERRVEVGRPVADSVRRGERGELAGVAAHEEEVGDDAPSVGQRHAALVADGEERPREMLVRPHPPGGAVHDDAEGVGHAAAAPPSMRGMTSPRPPGSRSRRFHTGL